MDSRCLRKLRRKIERSNLVADDTPSPRWPGDENLTRDNQLVIGKQVGSVDHENGNSDKSEYCDGCSYERGSQGDEEAESSHRRRKRPQQHCSALARYAKREKPVVNVPRVRAGERHIAEPSPDYRERSVEQGNEHRQQRDDHEDSSRLADRPGDGEHSEQKPYAQTARVPEKDFPRRKIVREKSEQRTGDSESGKDDPGISKGRRNDDYRSACDYSDPSGETIETVDEVVRVRNSDDP